MPWLNLASWIPCTEVEGPGKRAALWVQGCDKRCVGCCNPDYLKIVEREILRAEVMVDRLLEAQAEWGLEGVTFLGGEPFLQAQGLAVVAEGASRAGLSLTENLPKPATETSPPFLRVLTIESKTVSTTCSACTFVVLSTECTSSTNAALFIF